MKRKRHTEQQIVYALKQVQSGTSVKALCRQMGITEATFYRWKKQYDGLGVSELHELKQLREENDKLKKLVANLTLDKHILQEVIEKKL